MATVSMELPDEMVTFAMPKDEEGQIITQDDLSLM